MSDKEYAEVYDKKLTDRQREILHDLYMSGVNHDGHTWVMYKDVERAVVALFNVKNIGE